MTEQTIGKLTNVDLRDCWPREDSDFTPWLAQEENIELLGEAIGIELEVQEQEAAVGSFSADILCRNTDDDSLVVVENQLEKTNHAHLGQLLTYAAGLDAVTLIWVVKSFREEHRATIDWLNRISDSGFHFFGIEVELFKIGESIPAPRFEVVAKPNDWSKTFKQRAEEGVDSSPHKQLLAEFWEVFGERLEMRGLPFKRRVPKGKYYVKYGAGGKNCYLCAVITARKNQLFVEIRCARKNSKAHFFLLQNQREEIEAELGYSLEWEEHPESVGSSIIIRREGDFSDQSSWTEFADWLIEHMEAFQRVFRPRIKQLDASEWVPEEEGVFPQ
jgi:hypothetical protein